MRHEEALKCAHEVGNAIKDLDHLYVSIIIRQNGERQVVIRLKEGGHYGK